MGQEIHKEQDQELSHGVIARVSKKRIGSIRSPLDKFTSDENEKS